MNREIHVRFWEGLGVRFPRATHLRGQRELRFCDFRCAQVMRGCVDGS